MSLVSAAAGRGSDQFDQPENFKKKTLESGRPHDACTPDLGVSFHKRGRDRKDFAKVLPRRPADRLRIGRTESQWSFSESDPAALPGSYVGKPAEEVSFLKRDPKAGRWRFKGFVS